MEAIKVRHQVAVGGRVTDAASERPISGARVRLVAGNGALAKEITSAAGGLFYFLDLPAGTYQLEAWMPGIGKSRGSGAFAPRLKWSTARKPAEVTWDSEGNVHTVFVDLPLRSTTIRGTVSSADGEQRVAMAEVRIKGSGERTFTDADGQYFLREVEVGSRTVQVVAPGYKPTSEKVKVAQAGEEYPLDFALPLSVEKDKNP